MNTQVHAAKLEEAGADEECLDLTPTKVLADQVWTIQNYGEDTLKFEGQDVGEDKLFEVSNCKGTVIDIVGRCQALTLKNCKNITVVADRIIDQCEIKKCKMIKIITKKQDVTLSNDRRSTKLSTLCCRQMFAKFGTEPPADE